MESSGQNRRQFWVGIGTSVVSIVIILLLIDPSEIIDSLKQADLSYIGLSALGILVFMMIRAIRWRYMLANEISWVKTFHIQNIGYMFNMVLPLRLGDVARAVLIGNVPPITLARGLSTMVVERILDMMFIVALLPFTLAEVVSLPAWMQDGAVRYFGQYFDKDAKTAKENSLGLCTFTMSLDGEISNRRYVSWAKDVSQLLPANDKGKIEDVGYLFFHDFIPTPSGSVFGVAESYRKTTDALGVAGKVLNMGGGGGSTSKIVVEDLYVFEFSPEFELKAVTRIEKSKHDVYLPAGAAYMSPQVLSLIVLYFNGYDYVFTQKKDDLFSVGYTDFEMRKGEKNGLVYGAVNYLDGELSSDKIDLATDAEELRVLPAKTGYIAVWEYYQKEKKMDIRLERVNF